MIYFPPIILHIVKFYYLFILFLSIFQKKASLNSIYNTNSHIILFNSTDGFNLTNAFVFIGNEMQINYLLVNKIPLETYYDELIQVIAVLYCSKY